MMKLFSILNINERRQMPDNISYVKIGNRVFIPNNLSDYVATTSLNQNSTIKSDKTQYIKIPHI